MKGRDQMPILFSLTLIIIVFLAFSKSRDKNAKKSSADFWKKEQESQFVPKKDISSLDYLIIPYASLPFRHYMPKNGRPVAITEGVFHTTSPTDFSDETGGFSVVSAKTEELHEVDVLLSEITSETATASSDTTISATTYNRTPEHSAPLSDELANTELELCKLADCRIINLTGISNTELRLTYGTANLDPLTTYDHNFTVLIRTLQKWGTLLASAGKKDDAITVLSYAINIGSDIAATYAILARLYKERGELFKIEELKTSAEELTTLMKPSILRDLDQLMAQP